MMHPRPVLEFLFYDQVRLTEIFSALNLLAWTVEITLHPEMLERAGYSTFRSLDALWWICIFGGAGLAQVAAMLFRRGRCYELRFGAMALAAGCWAAVTLNFIMIPGSTTAEANYLILTIVTAVSGGFLGWKTSSALS